MDDLTIAIGILAVVFLVGGGVYLLTLLFLARELYALGDMTWCEAIELARKELQ